MAKITANIRLAMTNEQERDIHDFVLYPKSKEIGEVTVVATKVKFYIDNDTLIFNADAFQLAQGYILEVLVRQLSNVTYNVNAQARTGVYTNVLPRYALLHIRYQFMVKPKMKK